ncbi:MAG: hypothetical protein ACEQSH_00550 [Bacteroidia bacterium]
MTDTTFGPEGLAGWKSGSGIAEAVQLAEITGGQDAVFGAHGEAAVRTSKGLVRKVALVDANGNTGNTAIAAAALAGMNSILLTPSGGDDTAAVNAALASLAVTGGVLVFSGVCVCASTLSTISTAAGIILRGVSSAHNPTARGGLRYTGTGSGTFLQVDVSENIHFEDLQIDYSNSGFSGTLVKVSSTARFSFTRCALNGKSVTSAAYLLDLGASIEGSILRTSFSGADVHVVGAAGSNAISFYSCDFDRYVTAAVKNPSLSWTFFGNAFENGTTGIGAAISCGASWQTTGLQFSGNWLGDTSGATAFSWITLGIASGCDIRANYIDGHSAANAKGVSFGGASTGVVVKGNYFLNLLTGVDLANVTSCDVSPNTFVTVTTQIANVGYLVDHTFTTAAETGVRINNASGNSGAAAMLRFGNDLHAISAFIKLNSSANADIAGANGMVVGQGYQFPIALATGGSRRLQANAVNGVTVEPDLAIPAGGTAAKGLMLSSTANFGVFFGSGAPSLSAAKGSIYLRSDGSTTNDRMYVNTNGSTTWTAVTTAA